MCEPMGYGKRQQGYLLEANHHITLTDERQEGFNPKIKRNIEKDKLDD